MSQEPTCKRTSEVGAGPGWSDSKQKMRSELTNCREEVLWLNSTAVSQKHLDHSHTEVNIEETEILYRIE